MPNNETITQRSLIDGHNVVFLSGEGNLPSTYSAGTLYFETSTGMIALDTTAAANGRKTFSNWAETAKLSSANTFTGANTFNQTIQGDISGNAATADYAVAADLAPPANSLVKFEDSDGTFIDAHIQENILSNDTYSYSFADGYALGKNSFAIGDTSFAFGENSFSNVPENFSSTSTRWILKEYQHDSQDPNEQDLHWYGPVEGASDPGFSIGEYIYDAAENFFKNRIKRVLLKTTWSEDHSTPLYTFSQNLSDNIYCSVYRISKGAFGNNSIAIGQNNTVKGNYSLAIGEGLITNNDYEIALGKYNKSSVTDLSGSILSPGTIFSIGNGSMIGSSISRSNIFEIDSTGLITCNSINCSGTFTGKISLGAGRTKTITYNGVVFYPTLKTVGTGDNQVTYLEFCSDPNIM